MKKDIEPFQFFIAAVIGTIAAVYMIHALMTLPGIP
jgi:hypothetical protein